MRTKLLALIAALAVLGSVLPAVLQSAGKAKDEVVKDGSVVSLQYSLSGEDGKLIESNKGKDPLQYTHGTQQIVPGLEKELAGMKVGGEKRVKVKPEDAYGPINSKAFQELPKEQIPPNGLKVGTILTAKGPQGQTIPVRVHEIKEKTVVVDLNHPMAGKTLLFDVKILDIQPSVAPAAPQPAKPPQPAQPAKPAQPAQPK
ncbi:MAG: peptidylprolyl isomerase [Deltaproteobacteria bacterium]|nr:peptidylprolyl isomerase [Deltaproteobacteria bacterium]